MEQGADFDALFSLDIYGEAYKGPNATLKPVEESIDIDETNLNVKSSAVSGGLNVQEPYKVLKFPINKKPLHLYTCKQKLSPDDAELCSSLIRNIRQFVYNAIQQESFCASYKVETTAATPETQALESRSPQTCSKTTSDDVDAVSNVSDSDSLVSLDLDDSFTLDSGEKKPTGEAEYINLELLQNSLTQTLREIEHLKMSSNGAPILRQSRMGPDGSGGKQISSTRRYYSNYGMVLGDDDVENRPRNPHVVFLSHLYRRKRNICYYCGFIRCARSSSSVNNCEYRSCQKCANIHRGGGACRSNPMVVDYFLEDNNWRNVRRNPWKTQPDYIKRFLRCFYCGAHGDSNFKCQGLSCPNGASTLNYRCLEYLKPKQIESIAKKNRHHFPHLYSHTHTFH
ncbi:hypothetical protein BdWA1_002022 [Babesia duncani]|uniref:Uncharacterized protein n=1 Tax=Babesia duncani TaxID=323732 RepID=A0AAD9PL13_9APIC|nr:hypothetical protein BdWA1_002022 [Babesia duncani]